ncbi:MAG: HRDC domain-containing protein [Candidatus Hydrogenedentes bacterium]|nr:HRDC domain-containing protein [Candidatus Hydrogenedentota bacterium]
MQFAFFSIPVDGGASIAQELNAFLRAHRVVSVQKELTQRDTSPCWRLCIEYLEGPASPRDGERRGPRVDYKEVLSEEDFAVFVRLREARKECAGTEGVPVYAICTNEQLAQIARRRPASVEELREIEGLGEAKCAKYGEALLAAVVEQKGDADAESGECD